MSSGSTTGFVETRQYQRFQEFCDACCRYKYIGLCYGPPGVGKTLSARHYTLWDRLEALAPSTDITPSLLEEVKKHNAVLFTPTVTNTPKQVAAGLLAARNRLYTLLDDRVCMKMEPEIEARRQALHQHALNSPGDRHGQQQLTRELYEVLDIQSYMRKVLPKPAPSLIIVDEADRLKVASLEQVRDEFDRSEVGMVLVGMPGIEKRLARYPQLYSRIGFVHEFRPLTQAEVRALLKQRWAPPEASLPEGSLDDEEGIATIIRITGGNFRLLHRLLTQMARVLEINQLSTITPSVVEAARESLVIGTI